MQCNKIQPLPEMNFWYLYKIWKYYAKWKKPDTEGEILYDSIYTKCPEEASL